MPVTDWRDGWSCINPACRQEKHKAEASCSSALSTWSIPQDSTQQYLSILEHFVSMADTDSLANPQTAGNAAHSGEHASPSAEDVVPLFDIIEACLEEFPALRELMPSRGSEIVSDVRWRTKYI